MFPARQGLVLRISLCIFWIFFSKIMQSELFWKCNSVSGWITNYLCLRPCWLNILRHQIQISWSYWRTTFQSYVCMHQLKETVKISSGKQEKDRHNENRNFHLSFTVFTIEDSFKHTKCSTQICLITSLRSNDSKFAIITFQLEVRIRFPSI